MGCYDTIIVICPYCENEFSIQTKLGNCELKTYKIWNEIDINSSFIAKNPCDKCNNYPTIMIAKHIIIGFSKMKLRKELEWGKIEHV